MRQVDGRGAGEEKMGDDSDEFAGILFRFPLIPRTILEHFTRREDEIYQRRLYSFDFVSVSPRGSRNIADDTPVALQSAWNNVFSEQLLTFEIVRKGFEVHQIYFGEAPSDIEGFRQPPQVMQDDDFALQLIATGVEALRRQGYALKSHKVAEDGTQMYMFVRQ